MRLGNLRRTDRASAPMRYGQRRVRRRMYLAECAQRLLVERTQPKSADVARPVVALRDGVIFHGLCADPADLLAIVRERDLRQLTGYCHRRIGGGAHSSRCFILRPISLLVLPPCAQVGSLRDCWRSLRGIGSLSCPSHERAQRCGFGWLLQKAYLVMFCGLIGA